METIKNIAVFVIIGCSVSAISYGLESTFLPKFLEASLITILIALMAINTTTRSVIVTKLKDLSTKGDFDFKPTVKELKISILEQVILIALAALTLIIKGSPKAKFPYHDFVLDTVLVITFCYAIHVLYDTANAVFVILGKEGDSTNEDGDATPAAPNKS